MQRLIGRKKRGGSELGIDDRAGSAKLSRIWLDDADAGPSDDQGDETIADSVTSEIHDSVAETKAPEETVTETKAPEETVTETKAPEDTVTEAIAPDNTVTEAIVPDNTVTEAIAPEDTITETKTAEDTVTETKTPENNITETKTPEVDFGWLDDNIVAVHNASDKVYKLLKLDETNTGHQGDVENLLQFLAERNFDTFDRVKRINSAFEGILRNVLIEQGRFKDPTFVGTYNLFLTFRETIQQAAEARDTGMPFPVPAAPSAAVPKAPANTELTTFLDKMDEYLENWWKQYGESINPANIKLERFVFSKSMRKLVAGKIPVMQAPDSNKGIPKMLLSNLTDDNRCDIEDKLFESSSDFICTMFGVSGIGKTRRIFEMLCDNFGFYFLAGFITEPGIRTASPSSKDFPTAISAASSACRKVDGDDQSAGYKRLFTVINHTSLVVYTRAIILNFLKLKWYNFTPKQWLLIQLYPQKFLGTELFTNAFKHANSIGGIQQAMIARNSILRKVNLWNGKRELLVFMDEAQVYQDSLCNMFPSEANNDALVGDLYAAVWKAFQSMNGNFFRGAVFCGTGFKVPDDNVSSSHGGTGKGGAKKQTLFCDMFPLDEDDVIEYMSLYVDITQLDDDVVTHCAKWLVGRPRWTAAFLQEWFFRRCEVDKNTTDLPTLPSNDELMHKYYNVNDWEKLKLESIESAWMLLCLSDFIHRMVSDESLQRDIGYVDTARTFVHRIMGLPDKQAEMKKWFAISVFLYACRGGQKIEIKSSSDIPVALYVHLGICVYSREKIRKKVAAVQAKKATKSKQPKTRSPSTAYHQVQVAEPLIVEAAVCEYGWMSLVRHAMCELKNQRSKAVAGKLLNEYCAIPFLEALFTGDEIEEHEALYEIDLSQTDFKGQWRTPVSAYGVYLAVNTRNKNEIKSYLEQLNSSTFEGQVPGWSLTENSFGADVVGQVLAADGKSGLMRQMVMTQVRLRGRLTSLENHDAHLATIPEYIWMKKRYNDPSIIQEAPREEVIKLVRVHGGIFRCILKYPAARNDPGHHEPGLKTVDQPNGKVQDCLVVVDGPTGVPTMLQSKFGETSGEFLEELNKIVQRT